MAKRDSYELSVGIINLKGVLPACRRCRIRSDEMLRDTYQPMICEKCQNVISTEYPWMVPLEPIPFERARDCLWNHERECNCWEEGVRWPEPPPHWRQESE